MKVLVILLCSAYALVEGFPGKFWGKHQPEVEKSVEKHWQFEDWKVKLSDEKPHKGVGTMGKRMSAGANTMPYNARWCVTTLCEMKKCKRMTTEFNYRVIPRMRWSCVKKKSKEDCMEAIQHGFADIMTAEGEEIYKAGKMYDMKPIMVAKYDHLEGQEENGKHYSVVLVKKRNSAVNTYKDMSHKKSCHPGMDTTAAFKGPMCSLINQGIVPKVGNVYESAGEFFKESCVPGVQHMKYNPNMTNPESLCRLCKGTQGKKDDVDFCMTMSPKEPHYGFSGAMKCLREGHGDVGFFHSYDVAKHYDQFSEEFDIVCKKERQPLTWENIAKVGCHLTVEHPQVVMVFKDKPSHWIGNCTAALENAAMQFSLQGEGKEFSLFDSSPYCPMMNGETPIMNGETDIKDEELDEDDSKWATNMKNEDLIFKHHCTSLEKLPTDHTYKDFLTTDMFNIWKTCEQLQPKPRAFICVVGDEEMTKCKRMIDEFYKITDLRHKASWGCVKAISKEKCVEMVEKNAADIVQLNATEMFLAGMDHNLAPFMGINNKDKDPWTESITIGIMLKNSGVLPKDMRGMKMCNAGVHKISGFLHPMGWLLANGTIERSTSFLQSIRSHFGDSCVPGMNTVDLMNHPLLSQTLDWKTLMHDTKWEDYYKTPMWRKWEDKKGGADNDYKAMHKVFDFLSPEFQKLMMMLTSEDPRLHAFHTPKIHQMMELLKKDFSWTNYVGLEDFYDLKIPKWKLISWVWQKPKNCTKIEWDLFMTWAEYLWDIELDRELYTDMWTDEDWKTFKEWMDTEYGDYIQDSIPGLIHKDFFIRMSLLCSRYYWLTKQWKILQWDNIHTKHFRQKMCKACAGDGNMKCSMDTASERYYDYKGAIKCLKEHDGDVAFVDWYAIKKNGFQEEAFALLCPNGKKMNETGRRAVDKCNFGHVPSTALVTCNMHDGVWRWKITKAFLEAQKVLSTHMFKDGIFGEETVSLSPIPFVNQTYQAWLRPKFLRAMEGIMQPSGKGTDWPEELVPNMKKCCDNHKEELPSCDEGHMMCEENCWSPFKNETMMAMKMKMKMKMMKMMMGRHGKGPMMPQKVPMRPMMGTWKKEVMMLWKPKGQKTHHIMWKMHKVPTSHMGCMGPMEHGMKTKMHYETFMEPMKYGMKPMLPYMMHKQSMGPMKYWMEKMAKEMGHQFPMMGDTMKHGGMMQAHIDKSIHSEFYSKVIFARNGTCSAIVHDLTCFGKKEIIRMWAGRVTKTPISVPLCYKPTTMEKTMVQFTCDTGASFVKSILLPIQCSYVPCNLGFWVPDWTDDQYWDHDSSYSEEFWGSKDWWKFDKRGDNDNWFLEHQNHRLKNRVDKHVPWYKGGLL